MNDEVADEELEEEELDEEELDDEEDLATVDLDDEVVADVAVLPVDDAVSPATEPDEDADEDADDVPMARKRPGTVDDEEDDVDLDDVEADLDRILKDKTTSADDDDDEDEEEEEAPAAVGEPGERVAAKAADEFTCHTCFLIVHPRQFGRAGNLTCPEGYDPCPSIKKVAAALKRAKKA